MKDRKAWVETVASADLIVVGGGGLLQNDFFSAGFERIFTEKKKSASTILWGAGHNEWRLNDWRHLACGHDFTKMPFDLIGVRDYDEGYEYVPCVSCMSPLFDINRGNTVCRDVGLYVHEGTMQNETFRSRLPAGIQILSNNASFEDAVKYLSECDVVLTDSFHGAYWATLLGRRVIAFPSSSKFYSLRHPVPLCSPQHWTRYVKMASVYDGALEECRSINNQFASKVRDLYEAR